MNRSKSNYNSKISEKQEPDQKKSRSTGVPPFGQAVGFLLSQLGYVVSRTFHSVMAEFELEPRHFALMRSILANEGSSQNFLVELLRIPASSMVSVIDHLEERGLVERQVNPLDRRSRNLVLTPLGRRVLGQATEKAMELEMKICAGLTAGERDELIKRLSRVAKNLDIFEGIHPASLDEDAGG